MSNSTDDLGETVYKTISELEHVDFVSLLVDICRLRGQQATIEVGNPDTEGDVVATQNFPFPQSTAVVCFEETLTKERLTETLDSHEESPVGNLAFVLREPPEDDAVPFAESRGVALYDPVDITDELLDLSATDVLAEYADSFRATGGHTPTERGERQSAGGEFGTIPTGDSSEQVTATVLAVVYDVDAAPIVYDHRLDSDALRQTVVLWEIENSRSETLRYGNDYITYVFDDGLKTRVSDYPIHKRELDGLWEPAPGPDVIPEVEAGTTARWISLVEHFEDREISEAILRGARGAHDDIRISLSEATEASRKVLPFDP